MVEIVLASNNPGKLRELRTLLAGLPIQISSPAELGLTLTVPEEGATFAANAAAKALAYAAASGRLSLADDSGLEVAALGNRPGVHSARFAGPQASDTERRRKLLDLLRGNPERAARFVAVVALAEPGRVIAETRGVLDGRIAEREHGHGGFGYDAIFIPTGCSRTLAELSPAEKNQISHRARAIEAMRPYLSQILTSEQPTPRTKD